MRSPHFPNRFLRGGILLFLVLVYFHGNTQIINAEAKRLNGSEEGWAGSVDFYFNYTQNTKRLLNFGNRFHVGNLKGKRRLLFLSDLSVSRSNKDNLINRGFLHARYNYEWNKFLTPEVFAQTQYNSVQRIGLRALVGAGPRFRLYDNDTLEIYMGSLYMYEYENISDSAAYLTAHRNSTYLNVSYFVNDLFSVSNITYYQPNLALFADYRISSESSLNVYITKHFTLRIIYSFLRDTRQVEGLPTTYHTLKNSLGFRF